jgi:hypothetical protein
MVCANNQRQLSLALRLYAENNNDKFYAGANWIHVLAPYVGWNPKDKSYWYADKGQVVKVGLCPSSKRNLNPNYVEGTDEAIYGWTKLNWCWNGLEGSYGFNLFLCAECAGGWDMAGWKAEYFWQQGLSTLKPDIPICSDAMVWGGFPMNTDMAPKTLSGDPRAFRVQSGYQMMRHCIDRHQKWAVVGFLGGQVEKMPLKSLWTLRWHVNSKPNYDIVLPSK